MFSITVIDDDSKREEQFLKILGNDFNIRFVSNEEDVHSEILKRPQAFIVDAQLDDYWQALTFDEVLKSIDSNTPVIIISNKLKEENYPLYSFLSKAHQFNNIIHYFPWEDFIIPIEKKENLVTNIKMEISKFYRMIGIYKKPDETINILHISDLQFGDPSIRRSTNFTTTSIPENLASKDIDIDIMIISGDIAYSGKTIEYEQAEKWINQFSDALWPSGYYPNQRIIIPGNHDFNFNLVSAGKYEFQFNDKKYIERKKYLGRYNYLAFIPFRRFCTKITGNFSWLTNNHDLYMINEEFINWGIRFICINTAALDAPHDPGRVFIIDENLDHLNQLLAKSSWKGDIYNILLIHHSPYSLGFQEENNSKKISQWDNIYQFIQNNKIKMIVHGHKHKNTFEWNISNEKEDLFQLPVICSSTISLDKNVRPREEKQGFNIISFNRSKGQIDYPELTIVELDGVIPQFQDTKPFKT